MEYRNRSIKFILPNGKVVDLLSETLNKMILWKQYEIHSAESCGFILGYRNPDTNNITLSAITIPKNNGFCSRFFCKLKTQAHLRQLLENRQQKNYYMGTWHTHPQNVPSPSLIDWSDWRETLERDITGSEYAFFIIVGLDEFRIWAGSLHTKEIVELVEAPMLEGIYTVGEKTNENKVAASL